MRRKAQRHKSVGGDHGDVTASASLAAPYIGKSPRPKSSMALFATTALSTGTLCGLALAASLALAPTPAGAGCVSGDAAGNGESLLTNAYCQATASGTNSLAIGHTAQATGPYGIAIGSSYANGDAAIAMGGRRRCDR
jgi:hypothetical protein